MKQLKNYIGGSWLDSASSETLVWRSPLTEEAIATLPVGTAQDVDSAVHAAVAAQPAWAELGFSSREQSLSALADAIEANFDTLAMAETAEMGKPLAVAKSFLEAGLAAFRNGLKEGRTYRFSERLRLVDGLATDVVRSPVGVVALIVPWNFTVATTLLSLGPLMAAGNTVVFKPSEKASISGVAFTEVVESAGLDAGVFNMVLGDGRAGAPLAGHPHVNLVHFTGSVTAGRSVGQAAAANFNRVVLELGGKDPVIVDEDVDPVEVAQKVAVGAFVNSGQICTSMERIYVHERVAEVFTHALAEAARALVMGDPTQPETSIGPMVDDVQRQSVARHVSDAVASGATVLAGGAIPDGPGYFYPPTVIVDVDDSMDLMTSETFGPVAPITVVPTFEEGVEQAKKTPFGLAATVYTNNPDHMRSAYEIPTGILWVNEWQGGGFGARVEPAGISGMGAAGGWLSYDSATRPMAVHYPEGLTQP